MAETEAMNKNDERTTVVTISVVVHVATSGSCIAVMMMATVAGAVGVNKNNVGGRLCMDREDSSGNNIRSGGACGY